MGKRRFNKTLLSQQSWGRSSERQRDREGAGQRRGAGVIGAALSATRGEPSPGLRPTPPTSLRCVGGEGVFSPPLPAKLGEVERAKQDREGAGQRRDEGVSGTALSAIRGEPSPGLTADPSHFAALRGRGGYKTSSPSKAGGGRASEARSGGGR